MCVAEVFFKNERKCCLPPSSPVSRLYFLNAIGRGFHQSHFYAVSNYGSKSPSMKRSCRKVPGFVNNEALDVVEIRVGGGDLLDA